MKYTGSEEEDLRCGEAMDALRKQLDVLMGANRNGDAEEVTRKYNDRDVCRLFLAGLCSHELFQLTVCVQLYSAFLYASLDAINLSIPICIYGVLFVKCAYIFGFTC